MIAFTFDIDWAPEEAIEDTVNILKEYDCKATLFATHRSEYLHSLQDHRFEIGLHPNYNKLLNGDNSFDFKEITDALLKEYPSAKGIRSHSLVHGSPFLDDWKNKGLEYDANQFIPYGENIEPFTLYNGLIRFPFNWEDDAHWYYDRSFNDSGLDLDSNGLKILNFHPIHVFANTPTQAFYESVRAFYQMPKYMREKRNTEIPGTRDALINFLTQIKEKGYMTYTLGEMAEFYRINKSINGLQRKHF